MKVTVVGGTGAIAQELIEDLMFRGYQVTVFQPQGMPAPPVKCQGAEVVTGALDDTAAVEAVVSGRRAVINTLDPRGRSWDRRQDLVEGTGHLLAGMHHQGVRRYIGHGTPLVSLCPHEHPTAGLRVRRFMARVRDPWAHQQLQGMTAAVTGSGLDWTVVRFAHVRHGPERGLRYAGTFGPEGAGSSVTDADIARFTAAQVMETGYLHTAPAISN
jgi:uncharacterized protein YbjT (DUF2867 family)